MAFLSLTLQDAYGRETSKRIELETQATLLEYDTLATAIVTDLQVITDLAIVRADVILNNLLELSATPAAGANVDVGATFTGELAGEANRKASHKVPGIKDTYIGAEGTIDVAQAGVVTYLAHFLEAGSALISDGEEMGSWIRGRLDR